MGIIKKAGDLIYTLRFLRLLTTKFEDTTAFKLGLIDKKGKRIKKSETSEDRDALTPFHRLVFNIKRIIAKAPGGEDTLASYAAALYLIKEKYNLSDSQIEKALKEAGFTIEDILAENTTWFMLDNKQLCPGVYRLREEKIVNSTFEQVVNAKDKVRASDACYPVGNLFGLDIYEVTHIRTNQPVYVAVSELLR